MEESVYSQRVYAGRRIYYFDVKRSSRGDYYLVISEKRRTDEGAKRDRIWVFMEDLSKFMEALEETKRALFREAGEPIEG